MAQYVHFGALTPAYIGSRGSGRMFLEALLEGAPEWSPEKYNYFEPINRPFDPLKIEDALDAWRFSFLWRRKRPAVRGSAWFGGKVHSAIYIKVPQPVFAMEPALGFLRKLNEHFSVDLSYVHVAHDSDFDDPDRYRSRVEPFIAGLTTHCLREGLPDVPWAMLYGPPYVDLFGRERLLKTPAAHVEETAGGVYVQLTPTAADVAVGRKSYLAAQQAAKEYLNSGAFLGETSSDQLRVPEFLCPVQ